MAKVRGTKTRKASVRSSVSVEPSRGVATFVKSPNRFLVSVLLFAIVVAVFLPSIRNDFFYWYGDDTGYVTENSHVNTGFSWENARWAFRNRDLGNWHPLTFLSHMLDCQVYGLKPWGHHLTSVLIHAANAALLFLVLQKMTGATWRCAAVALFFGLHPMRVESVAWVAERKDVLAAFFWIVTLLAYARYARENFTRTGRGKIFYGAALVSFACGLMSKGSVVTLPFVLLLLDYWPLKRHEQKSWWKLVLEKIPFFCLAAATSVVTFAAQKSWGFVQTAEQYSWMTRLENAVVSYGRYLGKIFWPVGLCGYYPHPGHWPPAIVFGSMIFIIAVSVLALVRRKRSPWFGVGWFWFLGTLIPMIGVVQLADIAMADRYSYIPTIGIALVTVWAAHELILRWKRSALFSSVVFGSYLIFFVALTLRQITYYKDSVTVWRRNFEVTGNVEVAQYALGLSLSRQGHTEEGIREVEAVLKAKPDNAQAHYNLGNMFVRIGKADEAIHHYREAVKYSPASLQAHANLGQMLFNKGNLEEAGVELGEAVRLDRKKPVQDARLYLQFATVLARQGRWGEAIDILKESLQIMPNAVGTHLNLGMALAENKRPAEAIYHFEKVLELDPTKTVAREYLDSLRGNQTP